MKLRREELAELKAFCRGNKLYYRTKQNQRNFEVNFYSTQTGYFIFSLFFDKKYFTCSVGDKDGNIVMYQSNNNLGRFVERVTGRMKNEVRGLVAC